MDSKIEPFFELIEDLIERIDGAFSDLPVEALDWVPDPALNPITVLIVHSMGSLTYWVGAMIGGQSAARDRSSEFDAKGLSKKELHLLLENALALVKRILSDLDMARLDEKVYSPVHNGEFTIAFALAHAVEHTALHLGHIEIMRELWENFDWDQKVI